MRLVIVGNWFHDYESGTAYAISHTTEEDDFWYVRHRGGPLEMLTWDQLRPEVRTAIREGH